jgi:hypothetical protein
LELKNVFAYNQYGKPFKGEGLMSTDDSTYDPAAARAISHAAMRLSRLTCLARKATPPDRNQFHITIGASPRSPIPPEEVSLEHELQIVKAALLYADEATLYSPTAFLALAVHEVGYYDGDQQMEFLRTIAPNLMTQENLTIWNEAVAKYERFKGRLPFRFQRAFLDGLFRLILSRYWKSVRQIANQQAKQLGTFQLLSAVRTGNLQIHHFESREDQDQIVYEFFNAIATSVSDGSTFPLFDDDSGNLIRLAIKEGYLTVSEVEAIRGRHCALAADLFDRLPLFEAASIDEIVDIRQELNRPLVNFRSAMMSFSDKIKSASWDTDFPHEAQAVFHREIAPAVLEIEAAVRANNALLALWRATTERPLAVTGGSALAIGLSHMNLLPGIVAGIGVGVGALTATAEWYRNWRQKQDEIEGNQLFFYYRTRKRFQETTR